MGMFDFHGKKYYVCQQSLPSPTLRCYYSCCLCFENLSYNFSRLWQIRRADLYHSLSVLGTLDHPALPDFLTTNVGVVSLCLP